MSNQGANLIDLCLIPLILIAYYQSLYLTSLLKLPSIYFYFILFVLIHLASSITILLSNYLAYKKWNSSLFLMGMGPAVTAFIALFVVNFLPFFKWPFYIFKFIPNFDFWIDPLIMGITAFITQLLLRNTLGLALDNHSNILIDNNKN